MPCLNMDGIWMEMEFKQNGQWVNPFNGARRNLN